MGMATLAMCLGSETEAVSFLQFLCDEDTLWKWEGTHTGLHLLASHYSALSLESDV